MTSLAREVAFKSPLTNLDATELLNLDYQYLNDLFGAYEHIGSTAEKKKLSKVLCDALLASARSEEEIFFPEIKKCLKEKGLVSAIIMEHSILKYLVAEIENLDADSVIYDIKIKVLGEHLKQLVREKQSKLFPKVIASGKVDLWRLGAELSAFKAAIKRNSHSA